MPYLVMNPDKVRAWTPGWSVASGSLVESGVHTALRGTVAFSARLAAIRR